MFRIRTHAASPSDSPTVGLKAQDPVMTSKSHVGMSVTIASELHGTKQSCSSGHSSLLFDRGNIQELWKKRRFGLEGQTYTKDQKHTVHILTYSSCYLTSYHIPKKHRNPAARCGGSPPCDFPGLWPACSIERADVLGFRCSQDSYCTGVQVQSKN